MQLHMNTLIVFYSRTGTTRKVAGALADALNAEIAEIQCNRYGPGPLRYLLAGYDSVRGNLRPIDMPQVRFSDFDLLLIGAPIWTSYPALPLRAFLTQATELPGRVALFLTYGGHSPPQKAIRSVSALLPVALELEATLSLRQEHVHGGDISGAVDQFLKKVRR